MLRIGEVVLRKGVHALDVQIKQEGLVEIVVKHVACLIRRSGGALSVS